LLRVLKEGIYTTAMPSFRRFSEAQLNGLADYVRLLAVRGETEILILSDYGADPGLGISLERVLDNYRLVWERWQASNDKRIAVEGQVPASTPEAIARGRDLFLNAKGANCIKCHGPEGRGDGESAWEIDSASGLRRLALDEWGHEIQPRDLTRGVFRLGRRPIDIYRRIHAGINGTAMPAHMGMQITEADGSTRTLAESDLWDLVHFVRSLSTRPMHTAKAPVPAQHGQDSGAHH
jgi:mono/diheme cytochrome c family protein